MKITKLFQEFFKSEQTGGVFLITLTLVSIGLSNSTYNAEYFSLINCRLFDIPLVTIVNDGLMTIFFLMIGLELEREVYIGELSRLKDAVLPTVAAIGGMVVPAFIYFILTYESQYSSGIGIPMATDIAFALGVLTMLGRRVPNALKVFITALAVIDDLGAILVIAIFYSDTISLYFLCLSLIIWGMLFCFNRLKIHHFLPYLIGGITMWYCIHSSGIHATISGVLVAFALPFGDGSDQTISYRLQKILHKPVSYFILPLFAMVNTAIILPSVSEIHALPIFCFAIFLAMVIGKPIGITLFSYLVQKLFPKNVSTIKTSSILGAGILCGIGFTMSIFITVCAFSDPQTILLAKFAILISSLISAILGFLFLRSKLRF
ncbi:MAG: Na+/H+ antiporter NhaA [Chitinophagales bacterium]